LWSSKVNGPQEVSCTGKIVLAQHQTRSNSSEIQAQYIGAGGVSYVKIYWTERVNLGTKFNWTQNKNKQMVCKFKRKEKWLWGLVEILMHQRKLFEMLIAWAEAWEVKVDCG